MIPYASNLRLRMGPTPNGVLGLKEKRLRLHHTLTLNQTASLSGSKYARQLDSYLFLYDEVDYHKNNASDPAADSLTLNQQASINLERPRGTSDTLNLTQHVHVVLEGYHPLNSNRYEVTANEAVVVGQPVYISGNNTVNLASASDVTTSKVFGLVIVGATANNQASVVSEGSVEQADWTSVTGTALLTPGSIYYLSTAIGEMSVSPPDGEGEVVVMLGTAVTTTKFDVNVIERALL